MDSHAGIAGSGHCVTWRTRASGGSYASGGAPYPALYSAWSAAWWQWAMEQPLAGHPFVDDPAFNVTSGQHGPVWFLGWPFGTVERHVTIPAGKFLFVALLNAEASDLDGLGATKAERRETAIWQADHIVKRSGFII